MAKAIIILIFALLLTGCSTEFYDPDSKYVAEEPLFYMVLGFRNFTINPNDYGMISEADNPFMLTLEGAKELAQKVTNVAEEEYGVKFDGTVVKVIEVK